MEDNYVNGLISVIVPVYNGEYHISKCIESVLEQTYSKWELIIIDDGSEDSTQKIINQFAERDKRIKYYFQKNQGAGMARNNGIARASGDYIVFLDSDDYIDENYFQLLSKHKEDVVFIDVLQKKCDGDVIREERMSQYAKSGIDKILRLQMTGAIPWGGWRKAVKKSIICNNNIKYSNDVVGEEATFSFLLLFYSKSIGFIDKPVYFYIIHDGSLSTTKMDDPWGNVVKNLVVKTKEIGVYEKYADTLNAFVVSSTSVSMRRIAGYYSWREYKKKARKRIKEYEKTLDYDYKIDVSSLRKEAKVMRILLKMHLKTIIFILAKIYK